MPTIERFIKPELFLNYKGVSVYHVYKNDNFNDCVRKYEYTTQCKYDDEEAVFDIRELGVKKEVIDLIYAKPPFHSNEQDKLKLDKQWDEWNKIGEKKAITEVIKCAIKEKLIVMPEDVKRNTKIEL